MVSSFIWIVCCVFCLWAGGSVAEEKLLQLSFDDEKQPWACPENFKISSSEKPPIWDKDGANGGCLRFDGLENYLSVKYAPELDFGEDQSFTVEFYYYPEPVAEAESVWPLLLSKGDHPRTFWRISAHQKQGSPSFVGGSRADGKYVLRHHIVAPIVPSLEKWHHVALVRDAAQNRLRFYLDGQLFKEEEATDPQVFINPNEDLFIGGKPGHRFFKGKIDELIIWRGALKDFSGKKIAVKTKSEAPVKIDPVIARNWEVLKSSNVDLFPCPKRLELTGNSFAFKPDEWRLTRKSAGDEPGLIAFNNRLADLKIDPLSGNGVKHEIVVGLYDDLSKELAVDKPIRQGYVIAFKGSAEKRKIIMAGVDEDGLRYAWLTLGNLLKADGRMHEAQIVDWPDFEYRKAYTLPAGGNIDVRKQVIEEAFRAKTNYIEVSMMDLENWKKTKSADWKALNQYAAERGIRLFIYMFPKLLELGEGYQKLIPPGYNRYYYPYKLDEGLFGYASGVYGWSRDDLAKKRAAEIAEYLAENGFRGLIIHAIDCGGLENPGNWANRTDMDRKRWGDDHAAAEANLIGIFRDEIRKKNPDMLIQYVNYPYVAVEDKNTLEYYHRLSRLLGNSVKYSLREAPEKLLRDTVQRFAPEIPFIAHYPFEYNFYPSHTNSGRFAATFYFGEKSGMATYLANTIGPLGSATKWSTAEYMWNVFSPGAEYLPGNHYSYDVVFGASPVMEKELLPRLCRLLYGEAVADKLVPVYEAHLSDRIPELPNNILPADIDQAKFFENMVNTCRELHKSIASIENLAIPRAKLPLDDMLKYLKRCELLAEARLYYIQARKFLDAGQNDSALAAAAKGIQVLDNPVARERNRYLPILNDLAIANAIDSRQKRNEYLQKVAGIPVRVGFYSYSGTGSELDLSGGLSGSLNNLAGLKTSVVTNLTKRNLSQLDVLVFNATNDMGDCDENWAENVREFVKNGGGVIFCHNAVGRYKSAFQPPLFPEICAGFDGMYNHSRQLTVKGDECFEQFLKTGDHYEYSYFDHCRIKPGPDGKVILADEQDKAVMVTGKIGSGRVIYTGEIFGIDRKNKVTEPPFQNWAMLFNLIRWSAQK